MELTKFKASEVSYHIKHDIREISFEKSFGNEAIDRDLSKDNYSLIERGKNASEINKYRKQIEKEIFKYNRKNIVHAIEVCIQCPKDCPDEQKEAFFRESFNYIVSTLPMGERCVFIAEVHKDERHYSPTGKMISKDHLHIMYIPAVVDTKHEGYKYKLCADQLTKRAKLKALHPGLQKHLDKCGIRATVHRKKEGDGKQIPLTVKQLKELTAATGITLDKGLSIEQLGTIINSNIEYKKQLETLKSLLKEKDKELNELQDKIQELNNEKKNEEEKVWGKEKSWGNSSSSWGKHKEEEKIW